MSTLEWLYAGGWTLAVITVVTWVLLTENFYNRCVSLAGRDRHLADRLKQFFLRRHEYRIILRFLLLLAALMVMPQWLEGWRSSSGTNPQWQLFLPPVALWLLFDLVAPALPAPVAVLLLRLMLPVLETVRMLIWIPIVMPLRLWSRAMTKLSHSGDRDTNLEDEILTLVQQKIENAGDNDANPDSEHRMILGILDLEDTLVHEVMTPRVDLDSIEDCGTVREVKEQIIRCGHSRIPVFRESIDHIIGIVHAKDLLNAARANDDTLVSAIIRKPIFIPESKNVATLLGEFQQNRNHFAVVLDEYGGTAGIVTLEDIIEEILGDIRDEYDVNEEQPTVKRLPDGSIIADGRVDIGAIEEELNMTFDDEDFETIGGYVLAELGRIPAQGEKVETPMLYCEILEADPRRILKLRLIRKDRHDEN